LSLPVRGDDWPDEHRLACLRSNHGVYSALGVSACLSCLRLTGSPLRCAFAVGSFPCPVLCAADLSAKPARHRGVPARSACSGLSSGLSQHDHAQHLGACQRATRLAALGASRAQAHAQGAFSLSNRAFGPRTRRAGYRDRFESDRPESGAMPLGQLHGREGRTQAARRTRSARPGACFHQRDHGRGERRRRSGSSAGRAWGGLCHGSWIY